MVVKLRAENIFNSLGFHIGETVLANGGRTYMHSHDFYEIFLMEEGEMYHFMNGSRKGMRKGELSFVRPEDEHCFQKGSCKKVRFVNMAFSEEIFQRAKTISGLCFDGPKEIDRTEAHLPVRLERALESKLSFLARDRASLSAMAQKDLAVSILLDSFLILKGRTQDEGDVPKWLVNACAQIGQSRNYMEGLEKFVELSGKSQEHFTRCMKKYYQVTPTEYLNRLRLEQAALLLETTRDSVLDIMLECGFNNVSHFNQLFKKSYGMTPSRYRGLNHSLINPAQHF